MVVVPLFVKVFIKLDNGCRLTKDSVSISEMLSFAILIYLKKVSVQCENSNFCIHKPALFFDHFDRFMRIDGMHGLI